MILWSPILLPLFFLSHLWLEIFFSRIAFDVLFFLLEFPSNLFLYISHLTFGFPEISFQMFLSVLKIYFLDSFSMSYFIIRFFQLFSHIYHEDIISRITDLKFLFQESFPLFSFSDLTFLSSLYISMLKYFSRNSVTKFSFAKIMFFSRNLVLKFCFQEPLPRFCFSYLIFPTSLSL